MDIDRLGNACVYSRITYRAGFRVSRLCQCHFIQFCYVDVQKPYPLPPFRYFSFGKRAASLRLRCIAAYHGQFLSFPCLSHSSCQHSSLRLRAVRVSRCDCSAPILFPASARDAVLPPGCFGWPVCEAAPSARQVYASAAICAVAIRRALPSETVVVCAR